MTALPPLPSFSDVFQALHGCAPYPWQERLASHVVESGRWPAVIGVPTGAGKTAALDVALYALAAEADLPPTARRAPRRVVLVVDRRTIVDQAFARAQAIRRGLVEATGGPLLPFAVRLRALMGPHAEFEEPLQLALLRGGVPKDDGWARRPDQALLAVSTVDQVGSRLLFRGYGVRPTLQSLHAGLLGHDTLFLLDEVHLARPFEETLGEIAGRWRHWRDVELPDRWQSTALSATHGSADAFELDEADRATPQLARRLAAHKALKRVQSASKTHDTRGRPHRGWIKSLRTEVESALAAGARAVGVVVNRVDTAAALTASLSQLSAEVLQVTGRMRGADRVEASQRLANRAGPDWRGRRSDAEPPFICVATQCIEAGADLDFDAMVTEIASLDAVVQRVGRLNRTGDHPQAAVTLLAPSDIDELDDVIYGRAPVAAWGWLGSLTSSLVGPDALAGPLRSATDDAFLPRAPAAVLVPAHLDLLAQTGPAPYPDPEPALYLHGLAPARPEVQIVWRADVSLDEPEAATARLAAVPPTAFESLALPIGAARRWLAGETEMGSFGDAGGEAEAGHITRAPTSTVALRWDGEHATPVDLARLRPGWTLVVPSELGGLSSGTFTGTRGLDSVRDAGDLGRTIRSGRVVVRLDRRVHGEADPHTGQLRWPAQINAPPPVPDGHDQSMATARRAVGDWLKAPGSLGDDPAPLIELLRQLQSTGARAEVVDGVWVLTGTSRLPTSVVLALAQGEWPPPGDDSRTADGGSVVAQRPVALLDHLHHVGAWAEGFARAVGLPAWLADDLARAARWHDLGKADPRFQVLLHDGDEIRAAAGQTLAKSGSAMADRGARKRAWARACLPAGFRHEMASVKLLTACSAGQALLDEAHDPDLVLHLIAAHHGHARPLAPAEDHRDARRVSRIQVSVDGEELTAPGDHALDRLDSGVSERFWRVQRRYGWWGLAWLEAVLRLADHRASEAEERDGVAR